MQKLLRLPACLNQYTNIGIFWRHPLSPLFHITPIFFQNEGLKLWLRKLRLLKQQLTPWYIKEKKFAVQLFFLPFLCSRALSFRHDTLPHPSLHSPLVFSTLSHPLYKSTHNDKVS